MKTNNNQHIYLKILVIEGVKTICIIDTNNKVAFPITAKDIGYCFKYGGYNFRYFLDLSDLMKSSIWKKTEMIRINKEVKTILKNGAKNGNTRRG